MTRKLQIKTDLLVCQVHGDAVAAAAQLVAAQGGQIDGAGADGAVGAQGVVVVGGHLQHGAVLVGAGGL